jgi:hypothetical protein
MTTVWNGVYVPALDVPMDLNEEGIMDVAFGKSTTRPASVPANVIYINVAATIGGVVNGQRLSNDNFVELTWLSNIPKHGPKKIIIILFRKLIY